MISSVEGLVAEKEENRIVIEVAGVGYEIYLPAPAFLAVKLGERLKIFTADIVREDSHELFLFFGTGSQIAFQKIDFGLRRRAAHRAPGDVFGRHSRNLKGD